MPRVLGGPLEAVLVEPSGETEQRPQRCRHPDPVAPQLDVARSSSQLVRTRRCGAGNVDRRASWIVDLDRRRSACRASPWSCASARPADERARPGEELQARCASPGNASVAPAIAYTPRWIRSQAARAGTPTATVRGRRPGRSSCRSPATPCWRIMTGGAHPDGSSHPAWVLTATRGTEIPVLLTTSVGLQADRSRCQKRVRRRVSSSKGRRVVATMPSLTSKLPVGSSRRLQRLAAVIRRSEATVDAGAVAAGLVEAHDEVAGAVVGDLDGVDLDARAGDRRRAVPAPPTPVPPADHAQRQVEALGLGDDAGQAGAVREQADRHARGGPGRRRGRGSARRGRG